MTVLVFTALLSLTVLVSGLTGGMIIRKATPALMRKPLLATGVLLTTLAAWLAGFATLGPMLAWGFSGPSELLPGNAAIVCQRCLDAASPLPPGLEFNSFIPAILLLAFPLILTFVISLGVYRHVRRVANSRRNLHQALQSTATRIQLAGQPVTLISHDEPTAFALTPRYGGIIVSTGLLKLLSPAELTSVISHEAAHLRQRHHLILNLLHGGTAFFRWIPLVSAINAAIPHYLEMAADNVARQHTSTPVLASALLKIGEKPDPAITSDPYGSAALHAAGVDRIRHLVAPPDGKQGTLPISTMMTVVGVLLTGSVVVHLPYLQAVLDGCLA